MPQPSPRSQPSWTGGTFELNARHRRLGPPAILGSIGALLVLNLVGILVLFAGLAIFARNDFSFEVLTAGNRIACYPAHNFCYGDPTPRIVIGRWTLGVFSAATLIAIVGSIWLRRGIIAVCLLQGVLLAVIVTHTIPQLNRFDRIVQAVHACDYGRGGACPGVRNLN
jgi:hypothetical protein